MMIMHELFMYHMYLTDCEFGFVNSRWIVVKFIFICSGNALIIKFTLYGSTRIHTAM